MKKETVNIIWFKRDLRLTDHLPLKKASQHELPCLLIYIYEPSLIEDPHYDVPHWRFVWESLVEMQNSLSKYKLELLIAHQEVKSLFESISSFYDIKTVF